jgi:hypothetical protein
LIWLEETAVAERFEGAPGRVLPLVFLAALTGTANGRLKIVQSSSSRIRAAPAAWRARRLRLSNRMTDEWA